MRVYLPVTLPALASAHAAGAFTGVVSAHAVTPTMREWYVEGDLEELEYAAMTEAAEASLRLIAEADDAPRRRRGRRGGRAGRAVRPARRGASVGGPALADVPLDAVASVHVDEPRPSRW
jgi:hypothetical protein